ncbi:ribonuclease R [candidate division KSB1 bacterium]|nr:ribonuclease R [candidate division KSB1 bacterium]NIR71709.1 ribonuclease R [candidate division KSB1 bacterium]NIS28256.1 ribonuclease R [candidate division KSB1 bacterium]NIT70386.1 ribonuclease R [candidate division KSB1 bacterium]NIU28934.1 ribonuclease R [candidate division KSB1 bacterium]
MSIKYDKQVNHFLSKHPHRTFKAKELARQLGIKKTNYTEFRDALKKMAAQGKIAKYKRNQYGTLKKPTTIEGELHVKTQGYGFLITEEGQEDIFISQKNMGVALDKDLVRVQLFAHTKGKSTEGRVLKVLKRARENMVGTYRKSRRFGFVVPDNIKITRDIYINEGDDQKAKSGQKVVAQIDHWEDERLNPEGHIVEILGFPDEPGVDVISVVKSFDLPTKFPPKVEKEAEAISSTITAEEIKRRLDLREEICFTIDPVDAKDFDDAVSMRKLNNGNFELGVHIADVSFYVQENSTIDKEALKRGTSVYLVDRVVPMLPEKLSNEICSLRPDEDRLTLSCIMEVTSKGQVVNYKISETVIRSKQRFSYEDVQDIITGKNRNGPFAGEIGQMHKLSQTLIKRRQQLGSLDFDLPEVKVHLEEDGSPSAIKRVERLDSHRLIEEFMLLANKTVTEHINITMAENGRVPPFIYRIHEEPQTEKMNDFKKFVRALGYPIDVNKKITAKLLGEFLDTIRGKPEEVMIEDLMLRSMMKAKYSTHNAGHFGLAFKHYTHFTSPIRRYPDMAVHRLLKEYQYEVDFAQAKKKKAKLERIARNSSEREVVATEAERESIKMKQVEYMERHLGDVFDGIISGVVSFGIFVEITDLLVEGLVHISDLEDDFYFHDEKNYQLIGERTQKTYRLGDPVKVRVVRVDTDERVVDFILVDET